MHKTASIVFLLLTLLISLLLSGMTAATVATAPLIQATMPRLNYKEGFEEPTVVPSSVASTARPVPTVSGGVVKPMKRTDMRNGEFQPWDDFTAHPPSYTTAYSKANISDDAGDNEFKRLITHF
jgi:hypothetical protein